MNPIITNPDAARRAIAWAKANPTKITYGNLAENADGLSVSTLDPRATCFCLVGRVAREAGADVSSTAAGMATFLDLTEPEEANALWSENDAGVVNGDPLRGFRLLEEYLA